MERNLKFLKTMSVAEFKAQHNVEKIEVKRNEHTGKCFFVYGFETGACSRKVETGELTIPVISEVCSAETGDIFLLLHQKGEGGATIDNPEHMHPVQKEKESQIGSKRFDLNSHSGRYAPIFREK